MIQQGREVMELLTVKETAQMLRVSQITVRRYIASGRLPAQRVGRGIRVRREAIEDFVTPVVSQSNSPERSKWSRKPANYADEDLVEIYSPSSPGGVLWVPVDRLDEYLDERVVGEEDPLRNIIGIGASDDPLDIGENLDRYLADAILESCSHEWGDVADDEDEGELPTVLEALGVSIGIGRSGEPTNIAEHKDEYLAEAFEHKR